MKLHIFLALVLVASVAAAQSLDETLTPASEAPPPDTSDAVPMSAFEAIQPPPPLGSSASGAATAPPPLKLQLDSHLHQVGPYTPPPPVTPRIPGKEAGEPRAPAPSDWR